MTNSTWISQILASQILAFIVGGLIAAMGNYLLQKWSFNAQNEANKRDSRISAYNTLLGHIINYEADRTKDYIPDMGLWLTNVFTSTRNQKIKAKIEPLLIKKLERSPELETKLIEIKEAIVEEIKKEKS